MHIIGSIISTFRHCLDFRGNATRSEFWYFFIFCVIICAIAAWLNIIFYISLALVAPLSAVTIRRLHDCGIATGTILFAAAFPALAYGAFIPIQSMIKYIFGITSFHRLIVTVPTIVACLFSGLFFVSNLLAKGNSGARKNQEEQDRLPDQTATKPPEASPADTPTAEPSPSNADEKIGADDEAAQATAVAAACDAVIDLCAHYGSGCLMVPFELVLVEINLRLRNFGWSVVQDGGPEIDLMHQANARLLKKHPDALKKAPSEVDITSLIDQEKQGIIKYNHEYGGRKHTVQCFDMINSSEAAFASVEYMEADYAFTFLRIRLSFDRHNAKTAMKLMSQTKIYPMFSYHFSNIPVEYPHIGHRLITGSLPFFYRDGLRIELRVVELGDYDVKQLSERDFYHPACYIDFEMCQRMF